MLFNSVNFLFFFPVVVLFYFVIPQRFKWIWLLVCSYYFYMSWNPRYALLILTSTVITWLSGLLIDWSGGKSNQRRARLEKKIWLALSFGSNLAILFIFKYLDFALVNMNRLLSLLGIGVIQRGFDILLPVGISFYTFQALSYTVDVYRREIAAENILENTRCLYPFSLNWWPVLLNGQKIC